MSGKGRGAQFYVFYLGWKECRGLWGREFVEPIIRELVYRRGFDEQELPKLTIESTRKEMKITQLIQKKKKVEKLKYPSIPTKDITYATQALAPDEDVVACIYLGYNPQTKSAVHVHAYRCDSVETAGFFVDHLNHFIELTENKERALKIEQELISKGQVIPRPSAYVGTAPSEAPSTRHGYEDREDPYYRDDRRFYYGSRENMARDMPRNGPRDRPRDGLRDAPRDAPRDGLRDAPRDGLRDAPRDMRDPYARDPYQRDRERDRDRDRDYGRGDYRGYDRDPRDYRDTRDDRSSWESPNELYPPTQYEPQRSPRAPPRSPRSPRGRDVGRDYDVDQEIYQSVTEELKAKLKGRTPAGEPSPMLLPPKDYDTVHRNAGNLAGIQERKSTNTNIVGMDWSRKSDSDSSDRGSNRNSYEDPYSKNDDYSKWRSNRPPGPITRAARSPEPRGHWNGDNRRAVSPEPRRPYDGGARRGRSPTRGNGPQYNPMARAMSPPPGHELRNSYFPPNQQLPNYLAPSDAGWGGRNSPRPLSPGRYGRGEGSDDGSRYGGRKPKYTASNLGLVHGAPPQNNGGPRPRSDEGYLSMDRGDPQPYRGYEDNNHGYGKPKARDYPRDDSPPPREVIAGEEAHPELLEPSPDLPGSGQPFLY